MSDLAGVRLNLVVDTQRHQITKYLREHEVDLPAMVNDAIDSAVRDNRLHDEVVRQVTEQVNTVIRDEIKSAIRGAFFKPEAREMIVNAVAVALKKESEWQEKLRKENP